MVSGNWSNYSTLLHTIYPKVTTLHTHVAQVSLQSVYFGVRVKVMVFNNLQQYFKYIVAVRFIGGGSQSAL